MAWLETQRRVYRTVPVESTVMPHHHEAIYCAPKDESSSVDRARYRVFVGFPLLVALAVVAWFMNWGAAHVDLRPFALYRIVLGIGLLCCSCAGSYDHYRWKRT